MPAQPSPGPQLAREPELLSPERFRARLGAGRLAQIVDDWEAKRPPGRLPPREAIEPTELAALLPWLCILEPTGSGVVVRLAGTRVRELFGRELTGADLVQALPPPFGENAARSYRRVVAGQGWLTQVESQLRDGRTLPYGRLSLPLSRDGAHVDRILVALDWNEWLVGNATFDELYEEAVEHRRREAVCQLGPSLPAASGGGTD
jgi:hypothetical protein